MNQWKTLSSRVCALFLLLLAGLGLLLMLIVGNVDRRLQIEFIIGFLCLEGGLGLFYVGLPFLRLENQLEKLCMRDIFEYRIPEHVDFSKADLALKEKLYDQADRHEQLRLEVKQSESLALQNQINPHFLYNTLEAIRSDALIYGADPIAETTEALADFFRYTVSELERFVPLAEELHNVETYMGIQQYRFGEALHFEIQTDDGLNLSELYVPKMILQPLAENAIIHGLEMKEHMGTVTIQVVRSESLIQIFVCDDGVGMDETQTTRLNESIRGRVREVPSKRRRGIALRNVHERIRLLFGPEYGLQVFSVPGIGTKIRLDIPICGEERRYDA